MTFRIPSQERRLSQPNDSDVNGNIFATRNISFDDAGYIKLSEGVVSLYDNDAAAAFANIVSMFSGSELYMLGQNAFRTEVLGLNAAIENVTTTDTNAPDPVFLKEGIYFNGTEVVASGTGALYRNGSAWVAITGATGSSTSPVCFAVFPTQNSLLIGSRNTVQRINTSWAVVQTMTLPDDLLVTGITTQGSYAYISTYNVANGEAHLVIWTGSTSTYDAAYGVGTWEISAVRAYGSSVVCVTSLGQLLRFNGSGFDTLANLPVYYERADWSGSSSDTFYTGLHNRSLVVDGDLIYIHIDTRAVSEGGRYIANMPGGVWCYDPRVGLYHRHGASSSKVLAFTSTDTGNVNTTTDTITVSGITVPPTGSPVYYSSASAIGGLLANRWYYTIKATATTFKVADTLENAMGGVALDLTTATQPNTFYFISQADYGDTVVAQKGGLIVLNGTERAQISRLVFTSQPFNAAGVEKQRLCALIPAVENRGYVITPKMFAGGIADTFNTVTLRFKPLKFGDKIIVKYRDNERLGLPAVPRSTTTADNQAIWASTTTFSTVTTPTNSFYDLSTVQIGDEIEIISGAGAGHIAHVASISKSGYSYTITLDEACTLVSASEKMQFIASNYKKLDTIDHTYSANSKTIAIGTSSDWVQLKVELRGRDVTLEDLVVGNKPHSQAR